MQLKQVPSDEISYNNSVETCLKNHSQYENYSLVSSSSSRPKRTKTVKTTYVRKNYIDSVSIFAYMLGCSIVHLSLFISINFVQRPNIERAIQLDEEHNSLTISGDPNYCQVRAEKYNFTIKQLTVVHGLFFIICTYREIYESSVTIKGYIMRAIEICSIFYQVGLLIMMLDCWFDIEQMKINHGGMVPPCGHF